jgi:hypothetical protein
MVSGLTVLLAGVAGAQTPAPAPAPAPAAPTPAEVAAKQDSTTMDFFRRTEISGFADIYYAYNFNRPARACAVIGGVATFNCLRNFDVTHNSFSLNLAEVALEKKPTADSRGGFRIDLDYGPAAAMVTAFEPGGVGIFQNIEQAYVSYLAPAGSGLQLDFGKFVTPAGNEVIETKDNWNYSRGLLFTLAIPYYHMGARAAYTVNDKVSVTGYLVNGWNNAVDNNTAKTVIGSVTLKPNAAFTLVENYIGGPEQTNDNKDWRHLSDTVATYTATKQVSLAANYDYGQEKEGLTEVKWQGIAGFVRFTPNDWFALSPRLEWFDDKNGFSTGTVQKITEATVTLEFKHKDGFLTRVEYRGDFSNIPFFIGEADSRTLKKSQNTLTIGFIYAFTTKAQ